MKGEKMTKWQQEARCRLIRIGKDRGGLADWYYERTEHSERLVADYCDGSSVALLADCDGTGQYNTVDQYEGGWGQWLPDALRAG